ncbi:hypothetical protein H2201_008854 [Coniosporium apollinis]|uniref:Uncharacterized protein n=1 Tax=Coniosporium apollinis TaxID=61459 RepID=A0ABQ9NF79_9PEZI|nr:hypothetical protein H2201_008854 [Coniosporium apollinis]
MQCSLIKSKNPRNPAYKQCYNENRIVDFLKFDVIKPHTNQFSNELKQQLGNVSSRDDDLEEVYAKRYYEAVRDPDARPKEELEHLVDTLSGIVREWTEMQAGKENDFTWYNRDIAHCYMKYLDVKPKGPSYPVIDEWTRKALTSAPTTWEQLKASALYAKFMHSSRCHFVFALAGRELLYMKPLQADPEALTVVADILQNMKVKKGTTYDVEGEG